MLLALLIALLEGFAPSPHFSEQTRTIQHESGARIHIIAAGDFDPKKETRLVFYALPNGNTIEQTIGCQRIEGLDWHFDIQHIGAQTRVLRQRDQTRNVVIAYLEAEGLSWPAWGKKHVDHASRIRRIVDETLEVVSPSKTTVIMCAHSGGGSFITGVINVGDSIPDQIERIAYLDANYSYDDSENHGDKLLAWLKRDKSHALIVFAYDDRNVTLNGKPIVSETGGTYRASHRMIDRFSRDLKVTELKNDAFEEVVGLDGQIHFLIHRNPDVKILHTTPVGEMNGFLHAMTLNTPLQENWGKFAGPRVFDRWIQPAPATAPSASNRDIPARARDAAGGRAFMRALDQLPKERRDTAIVRELTAGNVPSFLRRFKTIKVEATGIEGVKHSIEYQVMPDYLAVGSDEDFVRVPMTPMSAQKVADAFDCQLSTKKIANDVYLQSDVKLEPKPLTEKREAVETFVRHHDIIETQRAGKPLGLLVAGIKKDVVITNRLKEKPDRVAIYGWHKLDGKPIQPLTIAHIETYVDYSHGIRLVERDVFVDGKAMRLDDVLKDPHLCPLVSDEGPIDPARYPD